MITQQQQQSCVLTTTILLLLLLLLYTNARVAVHKIALIYEQAIQTLT